MKTDIHPKYFPEAEVKCACGHEFTTGSTLEKIQVEICSACHPFYTGEEKFVDTEGRVEKFEKRRLEAEDREQALKAKHEKERKEKERREKEERERPKTLKEMLEKIKQ